MSWERDLIDDSPPASNSALRTSLKNLIEAAKAVQDNPSIDNITRYDLREAIREAQATLDQ